MPRRTPSASRRAASSTSSSSRAATATTTPRRWEAAFDKKWGTTSAHTGTQEITGKLQPRFNGGNPPDVVDDSGAQQIKLDVLYKSGQLADLAALLDAPSIDDPSKKVRDTLHPRHARHGPSGRQGRRR